jgi:phage baseplate assembly protein W
MDNVPHLALPLRIVGDRFVSVQQDTLDELVTNVAVITQFPLGYRVERPDFGIAELELTQQPVAVIDVEQAVEAFEPRATVRVTQQALDPFDSGAARVRIEVNMARAEEGES